MTAHLPLAELRLSQSMIYEALKCLYLFKVSTLEQLKPRFTPAPLRRGTLVAVGMEAARRLHFGGETDLEALLNAGSNALHYKHNEWLNDPHIKDHVDDDMLHDFGNQLIASEKIFERAFEFLELHTGKWETVALEDGTPLIEWEMSVPMPEWLEFGGKLDWVVRDTETGSLWLWDDKTQKRLAGEEYFETQLQAPAYQHLLRVKHGLDIVGTINYCIRAHVPDVPAMNIRPSKGQKVPGMSRKKISTDWTTYRAELLEQGLNPSDYEEFGQSLSPFQRIDKYFRTPKEVKAVWETVNEVAQHLAATKVFPRNLNPFNCMTCWMKSYCLADLRGHDTDFLSKTEYMREGEAPFFPIDIVEED